MTSPKHCMLLVLVLRSMFWSCLFVSTVHANSASVGVGKYTVHSLYLEEESGNDRAFSSLRDKNGYLWIATDNGLKRYDGYHLRLFKNDEYSPTSIGSNSITSLLIQDNGTLWASGGTLNEYIPETESFNVYDVSGGATIWNMFEDESGILWLGGEGFGLRGFDLNKRELVHAFFPENDGHFINAIERHGFTDSIWIASNKGLYLFNTKTHQKQRFEIPTDFDATVDNIQGLAEDDEGNLWIAAQDGLVVLNPNTRMAKQYVENHRDPNALTTNVLRSVFKDSSGQIWVGTDKHGVEKYIPRIDGFQHFPSSETNPNAFPSSSIDDICEDEEGTLWFSAAVYGLRRISAHLEKFSAFKHSEKNDSTLGFNNIFDLHEDGEGNIWIATDGGGLDKYNPKTNEFTHYKHDPDNPDSISSNSVSSLAEDANGHIWIGTWNGGVNRLDPKTGKFWHLERDTTVKDGQTLLNNNIFRIEIDKGGLLYVSAWRSGMQIYDPKKASFVTYSPIIADETSGISNVSINDFHIDASGRVWVGGYNGLEYFDPKSKTFTKVDLPGMEAILDIFQDADETLWLATSTNFLRYDTTTKEVRSYGVANGLVNDFVTSIESDDQGYLWLGTRHGINRFDPLTETFESFDESDGLAGPQFNQLSHLFARDGHMYFGGSDGLNVFSPKYLPRNSSAPQVHLTGLELSQTRVLPNETEWLDKHINLTDRLVLPYDQRDITFEFTALNFISPNKNRYQYRLKGWKDEWVEVDSRRRRVRYTNLSPGRYTFQVLGSNNEGVWSVQAKEVTLVILSAWWQAWWAKTLMAVFFLALVYAFISWRLWVIRLRQKKLERLVRKKTAELESANTRVSELNADLEKRVVRRTKELSVEIEERRSAEEQLFHMAFHDMLTGLPNRSWLNQHLTDLIECSVGGRGQFALFFLDGDRFKKVNDTHGHMIGDLLLQAATERLRKVSPEGCRVVRLGGDEFTIVIDNVNSESQLYSFAKTIIDVFEEPFLLEQNQIVFRMSIGMLICGQEYTKPDQILRDADIAMYRAKERGRGTFQMFDSKMLESTLAIAELEADLFKALPQQQFSVVFQPIIKLDSSVLAGFEVLLRWHHPERGTIPPDQFIPIAEDIGVILELGLWVFEQACKQLKQWEKDPNVDQLPSIAVNLSPLQLGQSDLIDKIDQVFDSTGANSNNIKLEITESALMENTDTVDQLLGALRERGIELAIDDFGTGYSSLSYLDKLPVQVLKVDRSFVDSLTGEGGESGSAQEIVKATISLAHNLNIEVVAEGIETKEQRDILKEYKCNYGQGFHIASPLSPADATAFLIENPVCA